MRIGEVIGTVTLSRAHPSLDAASYRLAVPLTLDDLLGKSKLAGEALVVYDDSAAGSAAGSRSAKGARRPSRFIPSGSPSTPTTPRFSTTFKSKPAKETKIA